MLFQQFLDEINAEHGYGVMLMTQMDAVPDTLQFVIATTEFDPEVDGLRDKNRYLLRAIGIQEHRISLGMFRSAKQADKENHPLLMQYNSQPVALFFRGTPRNVDALILNVFQTYSSVFWDWHHVPEFLNINKPLFDLFGDGGDLVGEMPRPLANALIPVLEAQGVETKVIEGERHKEQPEMKLLLLDESYIIAMNFTVDKLGG